MLRRWRLWLSFALFLATATYAIAETILVTEYHTSPRGFYRSIRTTNTTLLSTSATGLVRIGTFTTLPGIKLEVAGPGDPLMRITGTLRLPCPSPPFPGPPTGCNLLVLTSLDGGGNADWSGLTGTFFYF
jgi:hypothetical protein